MVNRLLTIGSVEIDMMVKQVDTAVQSLSRIRGEELEPEGDPNPAGLWSSADFCPPTQFTSKRTGPTYLHTVIGSTHDVSLYSLAIDVYSSQISTKNEAGEGWPSSVRQVSARTAR